MPSFIPITPEQKQQYLARLRVEPNLIGAARAIGLSYEAFRLIRKADKEFNAACEEAVAEGVAAWEREIARRAFEGVDEPLTHQGHFTYLRDYDAIDPLTEEPYLPHQAPLKRDANGDPIIATIKRYSDAMAQFMVKAHAPEKYRERQDITVSGTLDVASRIVAARKRTGSNGG